MFYYLSPDYDRKSEEKGKNQNEKQAAVYRVLERKQPAYSRLKPANKKSRPILIFSKNYFLWFSGAFNKPTDMLSVVDIICK